MRDTEELYDDNKINTVQRDEMKKAATDSYERYGVQRTQSAPLGVDLGPQQINKKNKSHKEVVSYAPVVVECGFVVVGQTSDPAEVASGRTGSR